MGVDLDSAEAVPQLERHMWTQPAARNRVDNWLQGNSLASASGVAQIEDSTGYGSQQRQRVHSPQRSSLTPSRAPSSSFRFVGEYRRIFVVLAFD